MHRSVTLLLPDTADEFIDAGPNARPGRELPGRDGRTWIMSCKGWSVTPHPLRSPVFSHVAR